AFPEKPLGHFVASVDVVRMRQRGEGELGELLRIVTENLREPAVYAKKGAVRCDVRESDGRLLERGAKSILALSEGRLGGIPGFIERTGIRQVRVGPWARTLGSSVSHIDPPSAHRWSHFR